MNKEESRPDKFNFPRLTPDHEAFIRRCIADKKERFTQIAARTIIEDLLAELDATRYEREALLVCLRIRAKEVSNE